MKLNSGLETGNKILSLLTTLVSSPYKNIPMFERGKLLLYSINNRYITAFKVKLGENEVRLVP